jgi:hypothetical protein
MNYAQTHDLPHTWNVGIHTSTNKVSHGRGQYGPRIEKLSYLKLKKNP